MENGLDFELCRDILSFGIRPTERVLHLGCGDKQTNLLDNLQTLNPALFYLGIDIDFDVIDKLKEKYSDIPKMFTILQSSNFYSRWLQLPWLQL